MKIDFGSLAFNVKVNGKIGGTPSWGTAIVYQTADNKIKEEIAKDILIGMIYKKIDCTSKMLSLPLGKGGRVYHGDENFATNGASSIPYLAARFEKTYVNGKSVGKPFILLVMKDGYDAHNGRLQLKYSPKINWGSYSNQEFFSEVYKVLGISDNAPMVCYDISVINQDELHFRCAIKYDSYEFVDKYDYNDFINNAIKNDTFIGEEGNVEDTEIEYSSISSIQAIYYGAPGTGKSHCIKDNPDVKVAEAKGNVFRTTFHPDSDYSTFVGAYKPTMKPVADKYKAVAGKDEEITYSFVPQTFLQAYIAAWKQPEENVYLVIEEINRGNCAQIFGDLFQLLDRGDNGESEYPIMADNDLRAFLERDENLGKDSEGIRGGKLKLPKNLHILATMNTSDQSLFPIDSAFKRRWEWKYMKIKNMQKDYRIIVNGTPPYDWWDFVEKMNNIIGEATASEDKKMGYFFCKPNLPDNGISAEQFVSKALFYIYGDALKDYPIKDEAFKKSEKDGKVVYYQFSDFYDENGDVDKTTVAAVLDKFVGKAEEKKQVETQ